MGTADFSVNDVWTGSIFRGRCGGVSCGALSASTTTTDLISDLLHIDNKAGGSSGVSRIQYALLWYIVPIGRKDHRPQFDVLKNSHSKNGGNSQIWWQNLYIWCAHILLVKSSHYTCAGYNLFICHSGNSPYCTASFSLLPQQLQQHRSNILSLGSELAE